MPDTSTFGKPVTLAYPINQLTPRLFVHNGPEAISNFLRSEGVWQYQVSAFILNYLREGDVFVDVGANLGYFSICAGLRVGPAGRVHAIEPAEENLALLKANVDLNGLSNVEIHGLAVSDRCGEAPLFRAEFNNGAHSLLQKDKLIPGEKVLVTTLDNLLQGERAPRLIKIDVQGAEPYVLRGMKSLLDNCGTKPAIVLEFTAVDLARSGKMDELFSFVESNNYLIRAFVANVRGSAMPPRIRRFTLRQIADDFVAASDDSEFDIVLLPTPQG